MKILLYICNVKKTKEFINLLKTIKEMKKVLLVLAIAGFFAACGSKAVETPTETTEETPVEETMTEETPAETAVETPAQ